MAGYSAFPLSWRGSSNLLRNLQGCAAIALACVFAGSAFAQTAETDKPAPSPVKGDPAAVQEPAPAPTLDAPKATVPRATGHTRAEIAGFEVGSTRARLTELSLDLLTAFGWSTATDHELEGLQGGHHDPRRRGFTLQGAEFAIGGGVDGFGSVRAVFAYTDEEFELEEATATTEEIGADYFDFGFNPGITVKAGYGLTDFGRINATHAHAWAWLDQPVIASRILGGHGMRSLGAQLNLAPHVEWEPAATFGVFNATNEGMASFLGHDESHGHDGAEDGRFEHGVGGRPTVHRHVSSFNDLAWLLRGSFMGYASDEIAVAGGLSFMVGPNPSGHSSDTILWGADLVIGWNAPHEAVCGMCGQRHAGFKAPAGNDDPVYVVWQTEFMHRRWVADGFVDEGDPLDATDDVRLNGTSLHDYGVYTQVVAGVIKDVSVGLRYEIAGGAGPNFEGLGNVSHNTTSDRDTRHRLSPMAEWRVNASARLRLQFNYDYAKHLDDKHQLSMWLGLEVLIGPHTFGS